MYYVNDNFCYAWCIIRRVPYINDIDIVSLFYNTYYLSITHIT